MTKMRLSVKHKLAPSRKQIRPTSITFFSKKIISRIVMILTHQQISFQRLPIISGQKKKQKYIIVILGNLIF